MAEKGLSPRQKMINLMYLVLTALLALDVSGEVLNAFVLFDKSIRKSTENVTIKNNDAYSEFEKAYKENPKKVGEYYQDAQQLKAKTNEIDSFIQKLKVKCVKAADGPEGDPTHVKKLADNNVGGTVMIVQKGGYQLKDQIDAYRKFVLGLVKDSSSALYEKIQGTLSTAPIESLNEPGTKIPWVLANFDQLPLIADVAMLSKMQNDIRNVESDMLSFLLAQIGKGEFQFNKIEAVVTTPSSYVLVGEPFEAKVFIAASDTTKDPVIVLNGGSRLPVENGKGIYKGNTSSIGMRTVAGDILMKSPSTGDTIRYPFSFNYQVVAPAVAISPTKMNVFYIGVDNPVAVTASGVTADQLAVGISGARGTIKKVGTGKYIVRVRQRGKATITVSAKVSGNSRRLGSMQFRCLPVPDPYATVGGKKGGVIAKQSLLAQSFVKAQLDNFVFDLKFPVTSFTVSATIQGFTEEESTRGPVITAQQKSIIRQLNRGSKVYFENIKAKAPDGSIRSLGSISFKLR